MALFETLVVAVGPAIAKTVVKIWAGDRKVSSEVGGAAVDALSKLIPDVRARKEAERQLQAIGEKAAESLMFIFQTEGKQLLVDDQEAVASLVAQALDRSRISVELLLESELDPTRLAHHFITEATEQLSLFTEDRTRLFTRVIEEASQSIIDIASVLPSFSERTFAELLRRDRVLIDAAQRTLESLDRIRSKAEDDQETASATFETEYRRALVRNLNRVELFGVDLSGSSRSHPLSVAYVSLDVAGSANGFGLEERELEKGEDEEDAEESAVQAVETALASTARLVVRGSAGAGKTTLVHWVAVRAALGNFESPLQEWNIALPFVVRLRQVADSSLPRPEAFPSLVAPTIADMMPRGWVHRRLKSGRAVVMIDGVDEVSEQRRAEVRHWVQDLVDSFPKCRFIITSRPHAVEQHWLKSAGFDEADLQPMDTAGIEKFVDHWHKAVAEEVNREEEAASLGQLAEDLKATLRSNRSIRRLATNPLLCSVICALHRDTNEQLPEDRLDLYERCCAMLLERRDPESGLRMSGYPRLSYRQKRALLDDLAYWMLKNEWSEIQVAEAEQRLAKKLETFRSESKEGAAPNGQSVRRFFLERSGILREPLPGKVDFAHRTFQEFMAASEAISEGDIGVLLAHATDPQWREVVILGAGLARRGERSALIQSLLKKGDEANPQLHLIAAACLDASVDVDSALRAEVQRRIADLFPPKSVLEAVQIADAAGEMAVPYLRRGRRYLNSREAAACVRGLAMIGSVEAIQAIGEYADEYGIVANEVVRSAARISGDLFLEFIAPRLRPERLPGDAVARLIARFGFEQLKGLELARALSLSGTRAGDLSVFDHLSHLTEVTLSGPSVTDLTPIRSLRELESITLSGVQADLMPLRSLPALTHLWIKYCNVDAAQLIGMPALKRLTLWGGKVANADALPSISDLESLLLFNSRVNPLSFLERMTGLRQLTLYEVPESGLLHLSGLHRLEHLYISGVDIIDASWLSGLTNLRTLEFSNVKFKDSVVFPFLENLQRLTLRRTNASPGMVQALRRMYPFVKVLS